MSSFVFNSFKQNFLNGNVPSSFSATFLPMNDTFLDNFTRSGFSVEQFRNIDDLQQFKDSNGNSGTLYENSKLKYAGIEYVWSRIEETDEQIKPMYINNENFDDFSASEYWSDCSGNSAITSNYINSGFYILRTKEELNWFSNAVNEGNNGIIGVIVDDISDKINVCIGNDESVPFQGILDGNGHALSNNSFTFTGKDNGLVGVLGNNGQVKNFVIKNDANFTGLVFNNVRQININYLRNDAADVNCGILVGRNYGTVSNIRLSGENDQCYKFNFSGFVPQVYSVSNKSDDIANFTAVRNKFDNGENYFFLNSWCINSPGNICPYVGYFAEGIFAQQGYGYDANKNYGCIEYNPKMKSYYDTGTNEIEIDTNDKSKFTLLAIYVKYDWFHDYLFDPEKNDDGKITKNESIVKYDNKNNLDYVACDRSRIPDDAPASDSLNHYIFDNLSFRKKSVNGVGDDTSVNVNGMKQSEIDAILQDPAWLSFNDDPKGRNAVAFIKYVYGDTDEDYIILELNGMLLYESVKDAMMFKLASATFVAGAINVSNLPPPVAYNGYTDDDKKYGYEIYLDANGKEKALISCGYILTAKTLDDPELSKVRNNMAWDGLSYDSSNNDLNTIIDISDSVRAFDKNGNAINISNINGFNYVTHIDGVGVDDNIKNSIKNVNRYILTNIVIDTEKTICTVNIHDKKYNIVFASKCLPTYTLKDGQFNNTHRKNNDACKYNFDTDHLYTGIEDFNDKFSIDYSQYERTSEIFNELYALENRDFPCCLGKSEDVDSYSKYFLHVNDYKQFIASNCYSSDSKTAIANLLRALYTDVLTDNSKALIKKCFEKVESGNGTVHKNEKILDNEINDDFRNAVYNALKNNLNTYLKHEVDYTNVTYASRCEQYENNGLKNFNNDITSAPCVSRHFFLSNELLKKQGSNNPDYRYWKILRDHISKRPYKDALSVNENGFYGKLNLNSTDPSDAIPYYKNIMFVDQYRFDNLGGSIALQPYDYGRFAYSPFISCSPATQDDYNIKVGDGNYIFDAGAPYTYLTGGPGGKNNLYRAAEMYVKNPNYYGLDSQGQWTTMAVRNEVEEETSVNQVNYNWNIMMKSFEGYPEDEDDDPQEKPFWYGIKYDALTANYDFNTAGNLTAVRFNGFDNAWARASCIPKTMLNKPIRMHNMVRAAYNVSPIVGANYGSISEISGCVNFISNENFVGFIGTVAGKNVNGSINDVKVSAEYNLNNTGDYVKYKNTPLLPPDVTKNMTIPYNPDNNRNQYELYPSYALPQNTLIVEGDYYDMYHDVFCITKYEGDDYKNNPAYIDDKNMYNSVRDFAYFTSAWYDNLENTETDDVIKYKLKPIYVIGGIAGRVVASNATINDTTKKSEFKDINFYIKNRKIPFNRNEVDIHSTYGGVIGKVDIQTTDTNYKTNDVYDLVSINNVNCTLANAKNNPSADTKYYNKCIGYIDYQPIDINTVVALYDSPYSDSDDYFGPFTRTIYTLDIPMNLDTNSNNKEIFEENHPNFANVNQSSGAFIQGDLVGKDTYIDDASVTRYYENVFNNAIDINAVSGCQFSACFDIPSIYINKRTGLVSVNSVMGSNTEFMPAFKTKKDGKNPVFPSGYYASQECLSMPDVPTRFYTRNNHTMTLSNEGNAPTGFSVAGDDMFENKNKTAGDNYFSYTYSSTIIDNTTNTYLSNINVSWDVEKCCYVADFTNQDGIPGDDIEYSANNYLVFGRSMSPEYIRSSINKADAEHKQFKSMLYSATSGQLGGFLVYNNLSNDLMMYISNDNGAELDGRSYNLAFEPVSGKNAANKKITGGNILSVMTDNEAETLEENDV